MVMKKKVWAVSVLEDRPFIQEFTSDFYTSDTDANLIIHLTDGEFNPSHATVTLLNTNDESIVSEEHPVKEDTITFPMHTDERSLISHKGTWRFQIIYIKEGEQYTSKIINFSVAGYLLNGEASPSLERIESWELIAQQAEAMLADYEEKSTETAETLSRLTELDEQLEENELARESAESVRVANEEERELNETERISKDGERDSKIETVEGLQADLISGAVDSAAVQQHVEERYGQLEEEYAPKLTEVTAQLAHKANKLEVRKDTDIQPISVHEMDTETKQLFTGGAVAVVGKMQ